MSVRPSFTGLCLVMSLSGVLAQQNRFEPNETRRTASRVEAGDHKGLFCTGEDWYLLNLEAGQRLETSIRFAQQQGDLELELHDQRGRLLGWSQGTRDEEVLAYSATRAMPVFVRVFAENATNTYDLHLGLSPSEYGGVGAQAEVNCWGSDWYPVQVESGKQLRVEISFNHAEGDLDLHLFDSERNELVASTGQANTETFSYTAEEDKSLLIKVWHVHQSRNRYTMKVSQGEAIPDDMDRVVGKERNPGKGKDYVELKNGDVFQGTVLNQTFRLSTPYADLNLPSSQLAGLDLERKRSDIELVVTVDNNRFSGFLRDADVEFQMEGMPEAVSIPRERILRVIFGQRGNERAQVVRHQYWVLKNGDHFSGQLVGADAWMFDMGFTRLPLKLSQIHALEFQGDGAVSLTRLDQSSTSGRLVGVERVEIALNFKTSEGEVSPIRFGIHTDRISTLFAQEGYVPTNVRPSGRMLSFEFEDGLEPWVPQGNWQTTWMHRPNEGVAGGGCVRACGPNGGNYGDNANSTLTSSALNIASLATPVLRMQARSRLERGPDTFVVRASYDGGATYTELHRITGDNEWSPLTLQLEPQHEEVIIQFGITSDGSIVNQGVWVDTVEIVDQGELAGPGGG